MGFGLSYGPLGLLKGSGKGPLASLKGSEVWAPVLIMGLWGFRMKGPYDILARPIPINLKFEVWAPKLGRLHSFPFLDLGLEVRALGHIGL